MSFSGRNRQKTTRILLPEIHTPKATKNRENAPLKNNKNSMAGAIALFCKIYGVFLSLKNNKNFAEDGVPRYVVLLYPSIP